MISKEYIVRYYVTKFPAIPEPGKEPIFGTICSKILRKQQFQNPKSVPEMVCCWPFQKRPICGVPEWVCCWGFWNGQKQSVPEFQKNNVLGTFLVLKTVFFGDSGILKKQKFQNAQKTMIQECVLFWCGGNYAFLEWIKKEILESFKNNDSRTHEKQCFRNHLESFCKYQSFAVLEWSKMSHSRNAH